MANSDVIQKIRERITISDVIRLDVRLTRKGNVWLGLCPFHKEKTPSFNVRDDKGKYHCFGCGAHGDAFDYLVNYKKFDFKDALHFLAKQAGVIIEKTTTEESRKADKLHQVLEAACAWYQSQLNPKSFQYLTDRGLTEQTIKRFRLGYSPSSGMQQALTKQGFPIELQLEAGLVGTNERGYYDWFRDRLMFPIIDKNGRICGFGGRTLGDGEPKYLNSPQTLVFQKKSILYGINESYQHLRKQAIVVEGYLDVISMIQAGYEGVVAPLGTALTIEQMEYLWRYNIQPILCFDGDRAGLKAARRSVEIALPLLGAKRSIRCALLPHGQDPDSLVRSKDFDIIKNCLEQAHSMLKILMDQELEVLPASPSPEQKALLRSNLLEKVDLITDKELRYQYRQEVYQHTKAFFNNRSTSNVHSIRGNKPNNFHTLPKIARREQNLLLEKILMAIVVSHPYMLQQVGEMLMNVVFQDENMEKLRNICVEAALEHEVSIFDICIRDNVQDIVHALQNDVIINKFTPVIRVTAAPEQVRTFWHEIWERLFTIPMMEKEQKDLLEKCKNQAHIHDWQRLKNLKLNKH